MRAWLTALGAIAVAAGGGWMVVNFIASYGLPGAADEERHQSHLQELWGGLLGVAGIALILIASAYL